DSVLVRVHLCQSVLVCLRLSRSVLDRLRLCQSALVLFRLRGSVLVRVCLCLSVFVCAVHSSARPLELITSIPLVRARQVDFQDNLGWVAQNMDGASLVDFQNPQTPRLVRQFSPDFMQPLFLKVLADEAKLVTAD